MVYIFGYLLVFNYYFFVVSVFLFGFFILESDILCIKCDREGFDLVYNIKRFFIFFFVSKFIDWFRVFCCGGVCLICWLFLFCEGLF